MSYVRVIAVRPGQTPIEGGDEEVDGPGNDGVVVHSHVAGDHTYTEADTYNIRTNLVLYQLKPRLPTHGLTSPVRSKSLYNVLLPLIRPSQLAQVNSGRSPLRGIERFFKEVSFTVFRLWFLRWRMFLSELLTRSTLFLHPAHRM